MLDETDIMGTDNSEKSKHNPDVDNLKSLLKKSGKKDNKKPNRVVFNENKNEFFDADYIILIREECDFDDEDDESVCTCYQHEMVRLTNTNCCEPNCNCSSNGYEEYENNATPPSPKFAPPIEFIDTVTLSPPEGYKDMELEEQEQLMAYKKQQQQQLLLARRNQRAAVCRECSASNDYDEKDEEPENNGDLNKPNSNADESDNDSGKIDQSQQTTPTSPSNLNDHNYMLESLDKEEKNEENSASRALSNADSPVSGILKGGRLWRQQTLDNNPLKSNEQLLKTDSISDDDSSSHRTVRFVESTEEKKDKCKSSPESDSREVEGGECHKKSEETSLEDNNRDNNSSSVEPTEMMLTFKLGNHVLISNNSLKPNSAVRQLFPCTKPLMSKDQQHQDDTDHQYLVTAESLRAFEDAKRAKLPQLIQSAAGVGGGGNDSIKRVIERNTLRRSLMRYEPRSKKNIPKTDNSLVERIKQLTCDIDDVSQDSSDDLSARVSPTGEEGVGASESNQLNKFKEKDRNFSPSSSSTTSSNSSMSSTYKRITDLFGKNKDRPDIATSSNITHEPKTVQTQTLPDIGGPYNQDAIITDKPLLSMSKQNPINESRKQFLSTLAPLTACVSNMGHPEDHYYHLSNHQGSIASSIGSEYTLDDIDEGLMGNEESKKNAPDVLAGTPASESGDELVVFVQQDANRIERIKKKYENESTAANKDEDDDENDDYGFNHRPSVRGIKPRFSSTTEILQQIQNQIQTPTPNANNTAAWTTGYPENRDEETNRANNPPQYVNVQHYRPLQVHENGYQNCANQTIYNKEIYKTHSALIGVEMDYNNYQSSSSSSPKLRNGRALSPPPQDISKNYHQMMVYIPYNHIEGYQQPVPAAYNQTNEYYRYHHNQINQKYIDTIYHHKTTTHMEEQQYTTNPDMMQKHNKMAPKVLPSYANNYQHNNVIMAPSSRSESPMLGNYSSARATQTTSGCIPPSCNYYPAPVPVMRYRENVARPPQWKQPPSEYTNKVNRHSFPVMRPKFNDNPETMYLEEGDHHHHNNVQSAMNGYYNYGLQSSPTDSPTKARYIERGVPEGAASISPQDSVNNAPQSSSSAATSPTLPQNVTNAKPMFYAMNV